jgi:uracil-DNA glycosylase family protein
MVHFVGAGEFVPKTSRTSVLAEAAETCHGCDLYERATQTVFGAGPRLADIMLVGEQPGDVEDRQGVPFVGPAGGLLDRALADVGIERASLYLTNAVKHFRWKSTAGSTRRIHQTPSTSHVVACHPWLAAELRAVHPRVVVALGATAAAALFGSSFRVTAHRGEALLWPPADGPFAGDETPITTAFATIHPSAVLRAGADRESAYRGFVNDLRLALEPAVGAAH